MNHHQNPDPPRTGMVVRKTRETYDVLCDGTAVTCVMGARLRNDLFAGDARAITHVDALAIGDQVSFAMLGDGHGRILERLPRRNKLSRPEAGKHTFEQVVAANLDQAVPVFAAANPPPKWNMLDRYLVTAEVNQLPALVVITKIDLAPEDADLASEVLTYRKIGYPVLLASAVTGEGLEAVRDALRGRLSVLLGKSGVGKSTLLNALQPGLGLRVNAINAVGKGRHTTTAAELFALDFGGAIVDTPGVREFGLWGLDAQDLAQAYPEMRPFLGRCRFGADCSHNEEPGCAVRKAVMDEKISPRRYQSYIRLLEEV